LFLAEKGLLAGPAERGRDGEGGAPLDLPENELLKLLFLENDAGDATESLSSSSSNIPSSSILEPVDGVSIADSDVARLNADDLATAAPALFGRAGCGFFVSSILTIRI
jgi:hypothetical protein